MESDLEKEKALFNKKLGTQCKLDDGVKNL